ncbi:MAG: hypothetical protein IBJ18_07745 [Phycisphaerales bacterium]|nr:hypothetical protein [Phycisphaerales bacterium]
MKSTVQTALAISLLTLGAGLAQAQTLRPVIYSSIGGTPTNAVPAPIGGTFDQGNTNAFLLFRASPDGTKWALLMRRTNAGGDYVILRGTESGVTRVIGAGDALPGGLPNLNTGTGSSRGLILTELSINNAGDIAFVGVTTGTPKFVLLKNTISGGTSVVLKSNDPLPGLINAPGGTPAPGTLSNTSFFTFTGLQMQENGKVAFQTTLINDAGSGGLSSFNYSAAYRNSAETAADLLNQQGCTPVAGASFGYLFVHSAASFVTTPDASQWALRGTQFSGSNNPLTIKDNTKIVEFNDPMPVEVGGSVAVTGANPFLSHAGDWYSSPRSTNGLFGLIKNGTSVLTKGGDPITPGNTETWVTDRSFAVLVGPGSNYIISNFTATAPTAPADIRVLVRNGTEVVARSGDKADLNNNGIDDDNAVIKSFSVNDGALAPDGSFWVTAIVGPSLTATSTGQVLLKIPAPVVTPTGCNPADIACDNGDPLASNPGCTNSNLGPNEGDYNAFFAAEGFFFQAGQGPAGVGGTCDIACDNGDPLATNPGCTNNGVNEGDYNCFFNNLFLPCV